MCYVAKFTDDSELFVMTCGSHAQSSRKSISSLLHVGMVAVIAFQPQLAKWRDMASAKILWSPRVTTLFRLAPTQQVRAQIRFDFPKHNRLAIQAATLALTVERKRDRCRHQPGDTKASSRTGSPAASFAIRSARAVRFTVVPCSAKAPDS